MFLDSLIQPPSFFFQIFGGNLLNYNIHFLLCDAFAEILSIVPPSRMNWIKHSFWFLVLSTDLALIVVFCQLDLLLGLHLQFIALLTFVDCSPRIIRFALFCRAIRRQLTVHKLLSGQSTFPLIPLLMVLTDFSILGMGVCWLVTFLF